MLHAFNGDTGAEMFAYIPDAVIPKLSKLTNPRYSCKQGQTGCIPIPHEYFVDGSPIGHDAYFKNSPTAAASWHTVLLGTTGAGNGKALFALDVSDPGAMSTNKVLWEITPAQSPNAADLADATNKPGFANNLGYTIPQPSIVRLNDSAGSYAAIVANGYNSANNKAVLFILDVATGAIIKSFDTGAGSATQPNGLSTPGVVDANGDRVADYIYAGDLLGNMWKFDITDANPANWKIAFTSGTAPAPLFRACTDSACATPQPITAKPLTYKNPTGGRLVYFGTGKYFEAGDQIVPASAPVQTFYAILDNGSVVSGARDASGNIGSLQKQSILAEVSLTTFKGRITANNSVNYVGNPSATPPVVAQKGWYMDLVVSGQATKGERIVSAAIRRGNRIIFPTLMPSLLTCQPGGGSWLMMVDALSGSRFPSPSFDINGSGTITAQDMVDSDGNGTLDASVSGKLVNNGGIIKGEQVVSNGDGTETINTSDSTGKKDSTIIPQDEPVGRQSWRQLR